MAEIPNNLEQQVEKMILAGFAQEQADETTSSQDEQDGPTEGRRIIDVDLYRLADGAVLLVPNNGTNPLDAQAVESVAPSTQDEPPPELPTLPLEDDTQQQETPQEGQPEPVPTGTKRRMKRSYVLVPLVLLCILAAGVASYCYLLPLTASATITIIPKVKTLHTNATLLTAAHPKADQVQGRSVADISLTKSMTVPATGHGHADATAARGVITFYKADTRAYTVPVGTSFTIGSVTVVTDTTITIQAVVPPMLGTAYVPAHVIQAGSRGNIAAGTIDTRCCGSQFLTATNTTPFSGGQDARSYSVIQASDIQNAASDLLARLTPQATVALQQQVRAGEQLVPPLCTPRTISNQEVGTESADVTVSVTQTCRSVAYLTGSLTAVATRTLAHLAKPHYQQVGSIQVTVDSSTYIHQTTLLHVSLAGVWVYHFSSEQLTHFKTVLAGKSLQDAQRILNQQEGIQNVSIHLQRFDFKDTLPTNPQRINVQLFYIVS